MQPNHVIDSVADLPELLGLPVPANTSQRYRRDPAQLHRRHRDEICCGAVTFADGCDSSVPR